MCVEKPGEKIKGAFSQHWLSSAVEVAVKSTSTADESHSVG